MNQKFEGGDVKPSQHENGKRTFPRFEADLEQYIEFGRSFFDEHLTASPVLPEISSEYVAMVPFDTKTFIYMKLSEYGVASETVDDASSLVVTIPKMLRVRSSNKETIKKVTDSYANTQFKPSFIRSMTYGAINSIDPNTLPYTCRGNMIASIPGLKSQPDAEAAGAYVDEMFARGFMTSILLRRIDLVNKSGKRVFKDDIRENDRATYEQLAERGFRPFDPEQILGMLEAEFYDVLASNPDLAAELEALKASNGGAVEKKPLQPKKLEDYDYGLDL